MRRILANVAAFAETSLFATEISVAIFVGISGETGLSLIIHVKSLLEGLAGQCLCVVAVADEPPTADRGSVIGMP